MTERIVVNGKFLGAPLNGVHRVAARLTKALIETVGDAADTVVLAPHSASDNTAYRGLNPQASPRWLGSGQFWEMLTLPAYARGSLLLNLCNLGPLLHGNSVVLIHDAQTFLYPTDYSARQQRAYRKLLPLIGRRARRILTVSEFARQSLAEVGIAPRQKIDVIHNGADHILDAPTDPRILSRHGLTKGGYVLTMGSHKGYKNIARLFAATQGAPLPLVVAGGPGAEGYRAKGWHPPPGATFTGFVSDPELRALYENAAVFAFPSLTEGFGLPPVEAMLCGCPVVAANAGAIPEICGPAAWLLDPSDTAAWRQALAAVIADQGLANRLRKEAAKRGQLYTWDAAGARLWSLLAPLLDSETLAQPPDTSVQESAFNRI